MRVRVDQGPTIQAEDLRWATQTAPMAAQATNVIPAEQSSFQLGNNKHGSNGENPHKKGGPPAAALFYGFMRMVQVSTANRHERMSTRADEREHVAHT
jgi:hypothetical protein